MTALVEAWLWENRWDAIKQREQGIEEWLVCSVRSRMQHRRNGVLAAEQYELSQINMAEELLSRIAEVRAAMERLEGAK